MITPCSHGPDAGHNHNEAKFSPANTNENGNDENMFTRDLRSMKVTWKRFDSFENTGPTNVILPHSLIPINERHFSLLILIKTFDNWAVSWKERKCLKVGSTSK